MDETLRRDTMHNIRETLDSKIQYNINYIWTLIETRLAEVFRCGKSMSLKIIFHKDGFSNQQNTSGR